MADTNAPKPSSSVKLVLLGEAAVGKVRILLLLQTRLTEKHKPNVSFHSRRLSSDSSTMTSKRTRSPR